MYTSWVLSDTFLKCLGLIYFFLPVKEGPKMGECPKGPRKRGAQDLKRGRDYKMGHKVSMGLTFSFSRYPC